MIYGMWLELMFSPAPVLIIAPLRFSVLYKSSRVFTLFVFRTCGRFMLASWTSSGSLGVLLFLHPTLLCKLWVNLVDVDLYSSQMLKGESSPIGVGGYPFFPVALVLFLWEPKREPCMGYALRASWARNQRFPDAPWTETFFLAYLISCLAGLLLLS